MNKFQANHKNKFGKYNAIQNFRTMKHHEILKSMHEVVQEVIILNKAKEEHTTKFEPVLMEYVDNFMSTNSPNAIDIEHNIPLYEIYQKQEKIPDIKQVNEPKMKTVVRMAMMDKLIKSKKW